MKVLVTGATGFVGEKMMQALLLKGHELSVLSRNPQKATEQFAFPVKAYQWNPENPTQGSQLDQAVAECDAVIHLAGESVAGSRWSTQRKNSIMQSRQKGTRDLVDAIRRSPDASKKSLISASAIGFYGNRGDEALSEASPRGFGFLPDVCVTWENEAFRARESGTRTVAIRIGIVLGQGGGALEQMLPPFRAGVGGPLADGKNWMSWIHIDDVVGLFIHALENRNVEGVLNGTAPHPVTNKDFTKILADVVGKPALFPVPAVAIKVLFGEMADIVLGSQKVAPTRTLESGYQFQFDDLKLALKAILHPNGFEHAHVYEAYQWVPKPRSQIFPFFSDEKNLETLTPPWLNFKVLGKSTPDMNSNTKIDYKLKLHGLPMSWRSKIEDWQPGEKFVDTQLKGPYDLWHHVHEFQDLNGGTLMKDRVTYRLPLGFVGDTVAGKFVKADVEKIFQYRKEKINEIFGGSQK